MCDRMSRAWVPLLVGFLWLPPGANAQTAVDTIAIAKAAGRAFGKESRRAGAASTRGPLLVDTAALGSRIAVAAIEASTLRAQFSNATSAPLCHFVATKSDPNVPYLFSVGLGSVTTRRAVIWVEITCRRDDGPNLLGPNFLSQVQYLAERRNGRWVIRGHGRVSVT